MPMKEPAHRPNHPVVVNPNPPAKSVSEALSNANKVANYGKTKKTSPNS